MSIEYPVRPAMPKVAKYLCMMFGIVGVFGGIASVQAGDDRAFLVLGSLLVGGAWFAFGIYGGLPLVDTVSEWHPPDSRDEVTEMHRKGLLVMRRRRWTMWLFYPAALLAAPLLIVACFRIREPGLAVLALGIPIFILSFRYFLSRCPRCGYGFFAGSTRRATTFGYRRSCGNCALSLYAYKQRQ